MKIPAKILVFGNSLLKADSIALRVAGALRGSLPGFEFVECDCAEDFERFGPDFLILDAAVGIKKVTVLTDLRAIEKTKPYSMHDFDLSITLKLLKKMGKLNSIKIIAVPADCDGKKAVREVKDVLVHL